MKTRVFILIACLALGVMSCRKAISPTPEEPEYVVVHLGVTDGLSTKAESTDDLYGINVYYDASKDGNATTHYAYGLFDNKDDMSISLLSGYTYKFECTFIRGAKSALYCGQYGGNSFSGYAKPFQTSASASTLLSNAFKYGTTYLSGITSGTATMKASSGYKDESMPSIQRYYGETDGYTPVAGGTVEIPLKKTVFGVRMIIDKVPEGTLTAVCTINTSNYSLLSGSASDKLFDTGSRIVSFTDVKECWAEEAPITATVSWNFTSSLFSPYNQSGSETVTFKRNTLTTITVSCSPDHSSGSISFEEESFGEENRIYLYLNSDGVIVIGIEPNPEDENDD